MKNKIHNETCHLQEKKQKNKITKTIDTINKDGQWACMPRRSSSKKIFEDDRCYFINYFLYKNI